MRTLESILACLEPGGLFITGCHQTLPLESGVPVSMAKCHFVHQNWMDHVFSGVIS